MTTTLELQLEDYILDEEIGRGDLTITFEGRRKSDQAIVAIKIVAPQFTFDQLFIRRFKDMGRQAIKLDHANIVRTYEADQEGETVYLVRELIDGRPLAQVIKEEGPFAPHRMLTIARQIAAALDYAHQKSITHGDMSANRVYIGANDHVTVADFGQTMAMYGTSLVKQGFAVGTPEIMAPERVHGQGATRQSDYYSLGILCYQMLAGESPFTGSPAAVLHAQAYEQPRPLHLINPGISISLSETIGRMLSKGLELRYNTGAEFVRALAVAIEGTAPIRAPATAVAQMKAAGVEVTPPLWKRPWLWILVAILGIILLLVLGFGAVFLWSLSQPANPATQVELPAATPLPAVTATSVQVREVVESPATSTAPTALPGPTVIPTVTPTLAPLPTPGPPVIAAGSPFNNLRLAHSLTEDSQPAQVGTSFAPGAEPIYLFFDFTRIEPGTPWAHRWVWGDTELGAFSDTWPENYTTAGTAWVYYSPVGGFQPGPYQVTLEINGQTVSTATFVVQAGGQ